MSCETVAVDRPPAPEHLCRTDSTDPLTHRTKYAYGRPHRLVLSTKTRRRAMTSTTSTITGAVPTTPTAAARPTLSPTRAARIAGAGYPLDDRRGLDGPLAAAHQAPPRLNSHERSLRTGPSPRDGPCRTPGFRVTSRRARLGMPNQGALDGTGSFRDCRTLRSPASRPDEGTAGTRAMPSARADRPGEDTFYLPNSKGA